VFGFTLDEVMGPPVELWPDNVRAWELFLKVGTQWRSGPNGVIGLDHNVVHRYLDRLKLSDEDWDQLMEDIVVMELQALEMLRPEGDN
jgi:hypothetical protein